MKTTKKQPDKKAVEQTEPSKALSAFGQAMRKYQGYITIIDMKAVMK